MPEETVPCPGCASPMGLDQEICISCRRPRDEFEIQKGRDMIRERAEKRRRLPFVIARGILAAFALGTAFHFRSFFIAQASGSLSEIHRQMEEIENPSGTKAPKTAAGAAVIALLAGQPAIRRMESSSMRTLPAPSAVAPVSPAPPRKAVRPSEPNEPAQDSRRLYGVVFDMRTLAPIPHALLQFRLSAARLNSSARLMPNMPDAITDADGRYQADFPASVDETMLVSVEKPGYRAGQVEDPDPSYLTRSLKERRALIEEFTSTDLAEVPFRFRSSDTLIPLNLALIPKAASPKPQPHL